MNKMWTRGCWSVCTFVLEHDFKRLDYTEGIEILRFGPQVRSSPCLLGLRTCYPSIERATHSWEQHFKRPVIPDQLPKDIKAFYMKQNDDGKGGRAIWTYCSRGIGENHRRSEREARFDG